MSDPLSIFELPDNDTIVAIATPPGRSALGILRISGPDALDIVSKIWLGRENPSDISGGSARVGRLDLPGLSDTSVLTVWRAPKSYTGQHLVELTLHGSPPLLTSAMRKLISFGARAAAPGEFTLRAIINGKLSIAEAGAIAALIDAPGIAAARAASRTLGGDFGGIVGDMLSQLDDLIVAIAADTEFPDAVEGFDANEIRLKIEAIRDSTDRLYRDLRVGSRLTELQTVVIAGPPNVGKSTLSNRLIGRNRSIVHHEPGTTRDTVESECSFGEIAALLIDTAGLRETGDGVELIGVDLAHSRLSGADLVLVVLDGSRPLYTEGKDSLAKTENIERIIVLNKSDLGHTDGLKGDIALSAKTGEGIEKLKELIAGRLFREGTEALWAGGWQIERIENALDSVENAINACRKNALDAALEELSFAENNLREALGENAGEDIIARVLENFCIGK